MKTKALVVVFLAFFISSCSEPNTYTSFYDFQNNEWKIDEEVVFEFYPKKTNINGDIKLGLRYQPQMVDSTVELYIKTENNDNQYWIDSIEVKLPRGVGDDYRSCDFTLRKTVEWQKNIKHAISISPAKNINNMLSISIEVDNATKQEN